MQMARVFVTGSSDGIGKMAANLLVGEGHQVIVHGRNEKRTAEALAGVPGAISAVSADLSSIREVVSLADSVNKYGVLDAVIHNAGMGYQERKCSRTIDGLPQVFAVNSLAPYILTSLITKPRRLVYVSSGLHRNGDQTLKDLTWENRTWSGYTAYADSKFHNVLLAFLVARKWTDVFSNAIEPGWVATKMGGVGAPDSLQEAPETQTWLATSNEPDAMVTGKYFYHKKLRAFHPATVNENIQELYLRECKRLSGISFPG
jgi:NAD(P)-dependent dehydrogenase (short-subunit alcohol dehydrogenase family)